MQHPGWRAIALTTLVLGTATQAHAALTVSPSVLPLSGVQGARQITPAAAVTTSSSVLVWEDTVHGLIGRMVSATGQPGTPFTIAVNPLPPSIPYTGPLKEQRSPAVAVKPDGSFVVVWSEQTQNCSIDIFGGTNCTPVSSHLLMRSYSAVGAPTNSATEVAKPTLTTGQTDHPAILYTSAGFWIVWDDVGGTSSAVRARRIDSRGRLGAVSTIATSGMRPAIALGGSLIIIGWQSPATTATSQVYVRLYQASRGRAVGGALALESVAGHSATGVTVAGRPGGNFLAAWQWRTDSSTTTKIAGQLVTPRGARSGGELNLVGGSTTGGSNPRFVTTGDGWLGIWSAKSGNATTAKALGAFTVAGAAVGTPVRLDEGDGAVALDDSALAIGKDGRVLAGWVAYDGSGHVSIRGRLGLAAPPPQGR